MFLSCTAERHFFHWYLEKWLNDECCYNEARHSYLRWTYSLTNVLFLGVRDLPHVRRVIHMTESMGDQITPHSCPPHTNVYITSIKCERERKKSINHSYLSHTLWTTRISRICGRISFLICLHLYIFFENKYRWQWR